jgi:hypothetical protein
MTLQAWFQHYLPMILFGAVAISFIVGLSFLLAESRGPATVGRGGLDVPDRVPDRAPESEEARQEHSEEIRQLLGAISELRVARGQAPIDIEAEVPRLSAYAELDPLELARVAVFPLATSSPRVVLRPRPVRPTPARRSGGGGPGEWAA